MPAMKGSEKVCDLSYEIIVPSKLMEGKGTREERARSVWDGEVSRGSFQLHTEHMTLLT